MLELVEACGDDNHQRLAVRTSIELIIPCLLRTRRPSPKAVALLQAAIVHAALAGDRDLLRIMPKLIEHLDRYTAENQPWSQHWRGQLATLRVVAELAGALLEIELRSGHARPARASEDGDQLGSA